MVATTVKIFIPFHTAAQELKRIHIYTRAWLNYNAKKCEYDYDQPINQSIKNNLYSASYK